MTKIYDSWPRIKQGPEELRDSEFCARTLASWLVGPVFKTLLKDIQARPSQTLKPPETTRIVGVAVT